MNAASWIVLLLIAAGVLWACRRILGGSGGCGGCTNESCTARKTKGPAPIRFVRKGENLPADCQQKGAPRR